MLSLWKVLSLLFCFFFKLLFLFDWQSFQLSLSLLQKERECFQNSTLYFFMSWKDSLLVALMFISASCSYVLIVLCYHSFSANGLTNIRHELTQVMTNGSLYSFLFPIWHVLELLLKTYQWSWDLLKMLADLICPIYCYY